MEPITYPQAICIVAALACLGWLIYCVYRYGGSD